MANLERGEYIRLLSIRDINELAKYQDGVVASSKLRTVYGEGSISTYYGSDEAMVRMARLLCVPRCYGRIYVVPGEEPLHNSDKQADVGLAGTTSLTGRVVLELARRLEEELRGDKRALERTWRPPV